MLKKKKSMEEQMLMHKKPLWKRILKQKTLWLMLMPALVYIIIFAYIPMGGIGIAFRKYNYRDGIFRSPWVGLDNFQYMIISRKLWPLTRNTILYNVAFIFFGVIFEVGTAIFFSEIRNKTFKKVAQTITFLPYFISWVVVATVMLNIFGEKGVLNRVLNSIGQDSYNLYRQTGAWPVVLVSLKMWKHTGYGTVIYMAAIAGISMEMFEAAKIDGANIWQRIRYVTLPTLKPTIMIMVLLGVSQIFRGDFGMFYQLVGSNQMLLETTDIIDTFVYRSLITSSNIGMSAAAGLYQSVLCFVTIVTFNTIIKKIEPDYTLF